MDRHSRPDLSAPYAPDEQPRGVDAADEAEALAGLGQEEQKLDRRLEEAPRGWSR